MYTSYCISELRKRITAFHQLSFLQRVANCDIIVIIVIVNADNYMVG